MSSELVIRRRSAGRPIGAAESGAGRGWPDVDRPVPGVFGPAARSAPRGVGHPSSPGTRCRPASRWSTRSKARPAHRPRHRISTRL